MQLPGDAKIGAQDDQTGEECAEYGQSHDEGGVVERLFVADPVYRAGESKWLRPVAAPAQEGKQSPQASIQPDPSDYSADGSSLKLDTLVQNKKLDFTIVTGLLRGLVFAAILAF